MFMEFGFRLSKTFDSDMCLFHFESFNRILGFFFRIDIKNDPYFMKMKYQKEYPGLASVGNGSTTDSYFGQGNLNCNYLESILSLHHS